MLKIGQKPGIKEHEDRWGQPIKKFFVTDWFWVGLEEWRKMSSFQEPNLIVLFEKLIDKNELERYLLSKVRIDKPFEGEMSSTLKQLVDRIEILLKWSGGSTVWEFIGLTKNKKYWIRSTILFNDTTDQRKRIWFWKDVYFVRPYLLVKCWLKNKLARLK